MAGILVSGGTYSGSGDVTTDWVNIKNVAGGLFIAPDGNLTLVANTGGYSMQTALPTGASAGFHSNGGTVVFAADGTNPMINVDGFNGMGHFYNVQATLAATRYHTRIKASGNLTIDAGATFESSRAAYTTNNTYVDFEGDLYVAGTFGNTVGDKLDSGGVGDAFGSVNIVGGTLNACSGNTTINYKSGLYSVIYRNNGTMIHNSGTLILNTNTDAVFGGGGGTGGLWDALVTERGAGTYTYRTYNTPIIENDLTISGNVIYNNNLAGGQNHTVSGNVVVTNSGSYANTGTAASTQTFSSLYIKDSDSSFIASPSGFLTVNKINGDSYKFRNEGGTFTHNDGTVTLDLSTDGGFYKNTGSNGKYLYNLTVKNDTTSARVSQHIGDVSVVNDLIVSGAGSAAVDWDAGFYNAGAGNIITSGTVTIVSGAKLGRSIQDGTFGKLILGKKGWFDAGTGTTTLQGATAGSDRTKILQTKEDSLFTHNSGTVDFSVATGGLSTGYIWLDGKATADPFWDTTFNGNTGIHAYTWYKFYAGSSGVITFEGDTAKAHNGSAVFELGNSSTFQLGRTGVSMLFGPFNWLYGSSANTNLIKSADTTYPAYISGTSNNKLLGTSGDGYTPTKTTLQDIKLDDLEGDLKGNLHLSGQCEVVEDLTVATGGVLTVASGQRATFGGTLTTAVSGMTISGALVEMTGAAAWMETGNQPYMGRDSASVIWNSTGIYSPDGGYLNYGWKNAFWNAEARVNQDGCFRNSNLIVAGQLDANNRAIGTSARPSKIVVANGGTVSSSTNTFNASSFSNRGGLFASSSAFAFDGAASSGALINAGAGSSIDDIFDGGGTVEGWVKLDSGGGGNVARLVSKDAYFIYFREDSYNNIRLQYTFNGGGAEWYTANDTFTFDNKWHHVAVTYDNSDLANDPSIYLDGKLLPLGTIIRPTGSRDSDVGDVLYVGNNPTGIRTLDGSVGMLRMFSDIRTAAEIRTDMFNQNSDMVEKTDLELMYQFDEGQGTTVTDVSTNSNTGTITFGDSAWSTGGTWTAGNKLGADGAAIAGNLYIGNRGTDATIFGSSYFTLNKRKLVEGSKMASKSHMGTLGYYIATSGTNDWLNYQKLTGAPIGTANEVYILADGSHRSYFNFDSTANNEQCHLLENAGYVRIINNSDFYTQDFDNSQGVWIRSSTYGGTIHDDGSTPHEYEPIDIMDDVDSGFDTYELID